MKILLPTPDYPPSRGGVARYLQAIHDALPTQVQVQVFSVMPNIVSATIGLLRKKDVDEVWVSHILPLGTAAWLTQAATKRSYVVFLHGLDFDNARRHPWKHLLAKRILQDARLVVTNSQALADEVKAFAGLSTVPRVVYPALPEALATELRDIARGEGAGLTVLKEVAKLAVGAAGLGGGAGVAPQASTDTPVTFLTVGRLVARKGHERVLRAIAQGTSARYVIVGTGPEKAKLEALVQELGLAERVVFMGDVDDSALIDAYAQADAFVMPTVVSEADREGFGMVYIEAGAAGLPVIATRTKGVDEAVIDGETGILVSSDDELLDAMKKLSVNGLLRKRMGNVGRHRALAQFSPQVFAEAIRSLVS